MTIKFNGASLPRWVTVTGISFQTLPNLELLEYVAPRKVGRIDGGVKRGASTIKLSLLIEKDKIKNIHQQKDELKAWAIGDNWKPSRLVFDEQPEKFYMARVSNNVEIDDLFTHGKADVTFYCADPLNYKIDENMVTATSGWVDVDNKGIETVPAIIIIQISGADKKNIRIENNKTNITTSLIGNFKDGQTITIDSSKKKVLLNGKPAMKLLAFDNKWLYLEHGVQRLSFKTDTVGASNAFQVKYREAD